MADLPSYRRALNQYLPLRLQPPYRFTGSFRWNRSHSTFCLKLLNNLKTPSGWLREEKSSSTLTLGPKEWRWTFGSSVSTCGHLPIFAAVYQAIACWRFPATASTCCRWLLQQSIMIIGVHGSAISAAPSTSCSAPPLLNNNRMGAWFHHRRRVAAKRVFTFQTGGSKLREIGLRLEPCDSYQSRSQMLLHLQCCS